MRILSVDYGTRRVGLALSDPTGTLAQGFSVLQNTADADVLREISRIVDEEGVAEVIVGYPRNMDGSIGPRAEQCAEFAGALQAMLGDIPVRLVDERLTTAFAERTLIEAGMRRKKRRQVVDALAAQVLLQNYLDAKGRNRDSGPSN
ncbi:MAG: Holliday junction resolvase RuvX [Thermoflavifilum sp.]|nr:Holliday junction resolvase RuvX [Thermoflavifilum sp.]MCL6512912.1 Holliday junction resolvase RuvX [Alicyclobacillus sp.]